MNMDFNLMDSSSHNKTVKFAQLPDGHYLESPESSDLEFPGGSLIRFRSAYYSITPSHIIQETKSPPFLQNTKNSEDFACTSLSLRKRDSMEVMREMMFRMAMMQPVQIDPESVKPPKRKNVRISKDPQSVAARHRRERISQRIRILQRMVPGGTKLDTASMLDEAVHYLKFLKKQVQTLEQAAPGNRPTLMAAAGLFPGVGSVQMLS
ncbi:hypothetical protein CDL12_15706 [Handroanthus impetiginosus]|uniref:BHLH domain-containing protein n=1 Tax=Handroanthus impetiginosus TaxID=429701 RepID=A0A2G9H2F1_9LAMI|nr:hypothetical protein CDL12_15706 [Handroanthus impetiginosus]